MRQSIDLAPWHAEISPDCGALLYRLRHNASDFELLRTPPDVPSMLERPMLWGFPVLFPPNRIAGGVFSFGGKTCRLPLNEPARHNHIHGILLRVPWTFQRTESGAVMSHSHAADESWPYGFTAELRYDFLPDRLRQTIRFVNHSDSEMPFLFGYHSAFHVTDESTVFLTSGPESLELDDESKRPTGKKVPTSPEWFASRRIGDLGAVSLHLPVGEADGFRGMILRIPEKGIRLRYTLDEQFRFWMLWNATGHEGFFCAEPQTCVVNAPDGPFPPEESGFRTLAPGEEISLTNELEVHFL